MVLTVLICISGFVILLLAGLLLPRVRFSGDFAPGIARFSVSNIWFSLAGDFRNGDFTFRLFFFTLYPRRWKDKPAAEPAEAGATTEKSQPPEDLLERDEPVAEKVVEEEPAIETWKTKGERKWKVHFGRTDKRKPADREKPAEQKLPPGIFWQERALVLTVLQRMVNSLIRLLKTPRLDRLQLEVDVATPDPALTGIVFGVVYQLRALHSPPRRVIVIRSDFNEIKPRGSLFCRVSIRPVRVLFELLYLILRQPLWRMLKVYLRARRQMKRMAAPVEAGA
jgi:hypothetical protein